MKLTEAYLIKLIKKSIKQFMCCCVGSTIGEGEPEGLAREGAIYIDEEAPALYYFDGTEWIALPSAPPSLWERTGTILSPTTEDDSIELTGAKTISTPNQQTFDDNAAALTALAEVGEHYTTPDGVLHQVMASVAGGGLPFKTIMWTAYATSSDEADLHFNVEYNDTGRTLSWNNDWSRFQLNGTYNNIWSITSLPVSTWMWPIPISESLIGCNFEEGVTNISACTGSSDYAMRIEIRIYE